jgi:predicted MPP superfamily phosphohydrolase
MNDDRLHEVLAAVPRDAASEGFTPATMRRLRELQARRRRLPLVAAASITIALAAGALAVRQIGEVREERRLDALRAERQAIAAELEELKRMTAEPPVVYVGGNDDIDVVMDVSKPQPAAVPVSWRE